MRAQRLSALGVTPGCAREPRAGETVLACPHVVESHPECGLGIRFGAHYYAQEKGRFQATSAKGSAEADWIALCDACHFLGDLSKTRLDHLLTLREDVFIQEPS